jgi:hypothetical protein
MGVPTASSGEVKTACGRAKDHGILMFCVKGNVDDFLFAERIAILNARHNVCITMVADNARDLVQFA